MYQMHRHGGIKLPPVVGSATATVDPCNVKVQSVLQGPQGRPRNQAGYTATRSKVQDLVRSGQRTLARRTHSNVTKFRTELLHVAIYIYVSSNQQHGGVSAVGLEAWL